MKYPDMKWGLMEAVVNILGGEQGVDDLRAGRLVLVDPAKAKKGTETPTEPLFTFVLRFHLQAVKEFVAKQKFVVNTSQDARVRISYLGNNFKKYLLPLVERDVAERDLTVSKLVRDQHDLPMSDKEPGTIAGLGGLTKAETGLCEFYEALAHKQSTGDLTWVTGYVRVYDEDSNSILWAVGADWRGDGWGVGARSVADPGRWDAGGEFLSR
jgi:hypothetical protein